MAKTQACGSKGCWTGAAGFFGLMTLVGIILVAVVVSSAPTKRTDMPGDDDISGMFCSFDCKMECRHGNTGDDGFGDIADALRETCCEGIEDCGPRVAKWLSGLFFIIFGLISFALSMCGVKAMCCCGKEEAPNATAQPAVVQAQAVEVSLEANTTV
jgi:hypothetical protein